MQRRHSHVGSGRLRAGCQARSLHSRQTSEAGGLQSLQSEKNARDHKDAQQAAQQAVSPQGNAPTTAGQAVQQKG